MKPEWIVGFAAALVWFAVAGPLSAQNRVMEKETTFRQMFPQGERLPERFSQYFIGQAYLAPLTGDAADVPVANVTFEPGCRNNWHSHTGGQLLICTAGRGFYQEKGRPARALRPGDVVEIAPDVVHWHGAAPDSWFSHLAVECRPQTNVNTWLEPVDDTRYAAATACDTVPRRMSEAAARNYGTWFPGEAGTLAQTDPELSTAFDEFAFGEAMEYGDLDTKTRILTTMASAVALNAAGQYRRMLHAAWANGVTPVEIKELLYHVVPYVGMARTVDFIEAANEFLVEQGVSLPLEEQAVVSADDRFEKGLALQKSIFGEGVGRMAETMPEDQRHVARYLSANCFGDYQTRKGLDVRQRELLTFAVLLSLGGCESQLKAHIRGNANVGNGRATLLAVVTQLLPYVGYPRTLNAIACLNEVLEADR